MRVGSCNPSIPRGLVVLLAILVGIAIGIAVVPPAILSAIRPSSFDVLLDRYSARRWSFPRAQFDITQIHRGSES